MAPYSALAVHRRHGVPAEPFRSYMSMSPSERSLNLSAHSTAQSSNTADPDVVFVGQRILEASGSD